MLKCFYPEIKLQADYDIDGKVLQLPIKGQGKAEIVLSMQLFEFLKLFKVVYLN